MGIKDGIERIDANILIRLITKDNPKLLTRIERLFSRPDILYVFDDAAMMEVVFVLTGETYKYSREKAALKIKAVMQLPNLVLNKTIICDALDLYVSHPKLSFVDCYQVIVAETSNEFPFWTFDKKLASQCPFAKIPA